MDKLRVGLTRDLLNPNGEPAFGRWQRLILFEMDEPKDRQVLFHVFGE